MKDLRRKSRYLLNVQTSINHLIKEPTTCSFSKIDRYSCELRLFFHTSKLTPRLLPRISLESLSVFFHNLKHTDQCLFINPQDFRVKKFRKIPHQIPRYQHLSGGFSMLILLGNDQALYSVPVAQEM